MRDREERERGKREEIKRRGRGERGREREERRERRKERERRERERGRESERCWQKRTKQCVCLSSITIPTKKQTNTKTASGLLFSFLPRRTNERHRFGYMLIHVYHANFFFHLTFIIMPIYCITIYVIISLLVNAKQVPHLKFGSHSKMVR